MFPRSFRRRNRVRVEPTVRAPRRISIARGSLLTISIRCGVVWMRTHRAAMDNSPDSNKASNPDSNLDNKANKEKVRKDNSRDKRASAVNRVNRVKDRVKDKMVPQVLSSRANRKVVGNRPAVHRMEASRSERANAVALLMVEARAMAGVIIGNYPP